jgi:simple sugar transport system permease protein
VIVFLLLVAMIRIAVPLALAACGGAISERSGVVNIALEGMLLAGAFGYALAASFAAGLLGIPGHEASLGAHLVIAGAGIAGALAGGAILAALHALVSVRFGADQVVSGVALNLLAAGLTKFLLKLAFGSSSNSSWVFGLPEIPGLRSIPILGSALGAPLIWSALGAVVIGELVLFRSVWGLRARAVGEHPAAAESAGIPVARVRWTAVIASGLLASLGGAWLAADQHQFTEGMSAGRGYIALAAVIFGKWRPKAAAAACLLFAGAEALQILLQGTAFPLPTQLLQVLPHALALVVLAGAVGRARPPAALGRPWPDV